MKQVLILLLFSCIFNFNSFSQSGCKVELEKISKTYTGACVNGKAEGLGKAEGEESFEGMFKGGYPDGKGMYIYKDGSYFIGIFKKGKREGAGDMYYESYKGEDSVITGFWKKDKYVGLNEQPYLVHTSSSKITRIECTKLDSKGDFINFNIHSLASSTSMGQGNYLVSLVDVSVIKGTFINIKNQALTNNTTSTIRQVIFPFRANFIFSNGENADISFAEPGSYEVKINLQ